MEYEKLYVEVVASFREDGLLLPKEIVWEDGRHFEIDKVTGVTPAASMKVGGQGDRYTIWLSGHQRYSVDNRYHSTSIVSTAWIEQYSFSSYVSSKSRLSSQDGQV